MIKRAACLGLMALVLAWPALACRFVFPRLADGGEDAVHEIARAYHDLLAGPVGSELSSEGKAAMLASGEPLLVPGGVYLPSDTLRQHLRMLEDMGRAISADPAKLKPRLLAELSKLTAEGNADRSGVDTERSKGIRLRTGLVIPSPGIKDAVEIDKWLVTTTNGGPPAVWSLSHIRASGPEFHLKGGAVFVGTNGRRLFAGAGERVQVWKDIGSGKEADVSFRLPGARTNLVSVGGIAADEKILYVSDRPGNRVLAYSIENLGKSEHPDFVLGQKGETSFDGTGKGGLHDIAYPGALATDGKTLAVADVRNHRVLLWSIAAMSGHHGEPADVSLNGVGAYWEPSGVCIRDGKLYITDLNGHRVLVWNSIPTKTNQPPDEILDERHLQMTSVSPSVQNPLRAFPVQGKQLAIVVGGDTDGRVIFVGDEE